MKYQWQPTAPISENEKLFAKEMSVPEEMARLYLARNIQTKSQINAFVKADESLFHDPMLLHDIEKACTRILAAIQNKEKIIVYGDYDVDGITSTTIMLETLEILGANVDFYIPSRFRDGYGPNTLAYKRLIADGAKLIVTVDNGVSGYDAIEYAKSQNVDVVITDHHQLPNKLPNAVAIVHPLHPAKLYPFDGLCGAGVAFKVACVLLNQIPREFLDLAALGTVADMMPLRDENRIIVKEGLYQLQRNPRVGLNALYDVSKTNKNDITETTIGFALAPRLNAIGRMSDATLAVKLLHAYNMQEAMRIAVEIENQNKDRRATVADVCDEVFNATDSTKSQWRMDDPAIAITGKDWPIGVLGIIAGQLVDQLNKPTIVLSTADNMNMRGSGRSVDDFNLYNALDADRTIFSSFGGHHSAVGLGLPTSNTNALRDVLVKGTETQNFTPHQPTKSADLIYPDDESLEDIYDNVQTLAPFGQENPEPIFEFRNPKITEIKRIGADEQTLRLKIIINGNEYTCVGFKLGDAVDLFSTTPVKKIFATIGTNTWNGRTSLQLMIKDII